MKSHTVLILSVVVVALAGCTPAGNKNEVDTWNATDDIVVEYYTGKACLFEEVRNIAVQVESNPDLDIEEIQTGINTRQETLRELEAQLNLGNPQSATDIGTRYKDQPQVRQEVVRKVKEQAESMCGISDDNQFFTMMVQGFNSGILQ